MSSVTFTISSIEGFSFAFASSSGAELPAYKRLT